MFAALAITGIMAYWFGTNESLLRYLVNLETGGMTGLGMIVMLAPFAFVLIMSFGFQRLSSFVLLLHCLELDNFSMVVVLLALSWN